MTAHATPKRKLTPQELLKRLVYEVVDGEPIYYKGYEEVLSGNKTLVQ